MKTHLGVATCLLLLLAMAMVSSSDAAGCNIYQLLPCLAASKNARVYPSTACCNNVRAMGQGLPGARCLCSLLSNPLARSQGVVPSVALGIPQKCRIPVPRGFVCNVFGCLEAKKFVQSLQAIKAPGVLGSIRSSLAADLMLPDVT